jgi:hypothetical protein
MRGPIVLKSLVILALCLVAGYFVFSNRGYGEVSDKAYEIATALYSVCNRQDTAKLQEIENLLASAQSDSSLSHVETGILQEILQTARAGDWESATSKSRALLEDQVKYP